MNVSIIIPAHNEEGLIVSTLESVLSQVNNYDQIIVSVNGCSDKTYDMAMSVSDRIDVLNITMASKTNAINEAEKHAKYFPRIYLDADVILKEGSLNSIKNAFQDNRYLAASTKPIMDFSRANWFVRAYYDIWLSLPYCKRGMMGSGVYILSKDGRERFDDFPDLISDDGYVRAHFKEHERGNIDGAFSFVRAPSTLSWLIKIKIRSRLGQMELSQRYPRLIDNETKDYKNAFYQLIIRPLIWHKLIIYLYVNIISRIKSNQMISNIEHYAWEKDSSSRTIK